MSREKKLIKNTLIISIGTFLPKFTSFITLPIVTSCLTQNEYGTYDLITTMVSFFLPMVTLQIQSGAFRFLIDHRGDEEKTKDIITNIIAFVIPISVLSLVILYIFLYKLDDLIRILICIYFFLDILILTFRQIVRGLANNLLYSISAVIESVSNMLLIIVLLKFAGNGIIGLLFSLVIATFLGLIVLIVKGHIISNIDFQFISKLTIKNLLSYSWPLVPTVISDWVLRLSDRMVITVFIGLDATAIYAIANKIPSLLTLVQNTFTYAWQENASLASKDDDEDVYYTNMFEIMTRLLTGATAVLIAMTPLLFFILVKGNYQEAYKQMPILFLGMLFSIFSSFIGGIYVAHKRTKSMGLTTMTAAVVNLLMDLLFIKFIGIYAASISTLLSYFFLSVYRMYDVLKYHQITYNLKQMIFYIIFLILMSILCWCNNIYIDIFNGFIGLLFALYINKSIILKLTTIFLNKIRRAL